MTGAELILGACAAEALIASSLIGSRSLYAHVADVAIPLAAGDLASARSEVARIVGRDTSELSFEGIIRAALEDLTENTSDGIVAPVFLGVLLGLPGMAAYKAVNTLDFMIGHRNQRHGAFGGFAARLDDVANFVPARLTGALEVRRAGTLKACTGCPPTRNGRGAPRQWRKPSGHLRITSWRHLAANY